MSSNKPILGSPIPASPHAVSVSMPLWQDIIGYEEGLDEVLDALESGYPRFVFNTLVQEAMALAQKELQLPEPCLLFPSEKSAQQGLEFILARHEQSGAKLHPWRGVFALAMSAQEQATGKLFWQHCGLGISSRRAQAILTPSSQLPQTSTPESTLRERIAQLAQVPTSAVYLYPSGMAAIHAALGSVMAIAPGLPTAQICFPYLDTLKLQRAFLGDTLFFPKAIESDLADFSEALATTRIAGAFVEVPSNPLLQTVDAQRLSTLAQQHSFPVVVDDTIGCFFNQETKSFADITVSSLTKYFAGSGDVMGGALVVNPQSRYYEQITKFFEHDYEDTLFHGDALVLERGSRDFVERITQVNATTAELCRRLAKHPSVARVYYGLWQSPENYEALRKPKGGYGGLFSLLLKEPDRHTAQFYDRLAIAKGPSFGMNQTMACPYTQLAHYHELDWALEQGVSPYLIRFSVGLESLDTLHRMITDAMP